MKYENTVSWRAPSNIALIKYWGKKENQIPQNPSLSITLTDAYTETSISFKKKEVEGNNIKFSFYFENKLNTEFANRIQNYFQNIQTHLSFLTDYVFEIRSENSFPHSSGIASSASSMASIALCLVSIYEIVEKERLSEQEFFEFASNIARLGSGSASRSVFGKYSVWGETPAINQSSDLYAIPFEKDIHEAFQKIRLAVLLVTSEQKKVSSTKGHALMHNHHYAEQRFIQANNNLNLLLSALKENDTNAFFDIVETEALSLHAMMMTSNPSFMLLKPNSVAIIEKIRNKRENNGLEVGFTIDAGANIHLLYFEKDKLEVHQFIENELLQFCEATKWLDDKLGGGPKKLI